jgi:hypothetical protein
MRVCFIRTCKREQKREERGGGREGMERERERRGGGRGERVHIASVGSTQQVLPTCLCRRADIRRWPRWLRDPQGSAEKRAEALSPAGWQQFWIEWQKAAEEDGDSEDD